MSLKSAPFLRNREVSEKEYSVKNESLHWPPTDPCQRPHLYPGLTTGLAEKGPGKGFPARLSRFWIC